MMRPCHTFATSHSSRMTKPSTGTLNFVLHLQLNKLEVLFEAINLLFQTLTDTSYRLVGEQGHASVDRTVNQPISVKDATSELGSHASRHKRHGRQPRRR